MRTVDIIEKKQRGCELSKDEIAHIIQGYCNDEICDYQIAAWSMAVYFKGMTTLETAHLTMEMVNSGKKVDLSSVEGIKVDKHSTGGVGDKTSLVLIPLVAACGVPVAKMSGRALGHAGGTLDKLESIKGINVELSHDEFINQLSKHGLAIIGQSDEIVPADKKLYCLRDVTGTVKSIPLIASSIMSKKIATGSNLIVLDIKTGNGAFMETIEDAKELAHAMVNIGDELGIKTVGVVSQMDQPLGKAVGNSLELIEAIETLKGNGPKDLKELCFELGALMITNAGIVNCRNEAFEMFNKLIENGEAILKLKELVEAQGGDPKCIDDVSLLPNTEIVIEATAENEGFISAIDTKKVGYASMMLGAGRETKESKIDYGVGIILNKKVGDYVKKGECIGRLHIREPEAKEVSKALGMLKEAYRISVIADRKKPLIEDIIFG